MYHAAFRPFSCKIGLEWLQLLTRCLFIFWVSGKESFSILALSSRVCISSLAGFTWEDSPLWGLMIPSSFSLRQWLRSPFLSIGERKDTPRSPEEFHLRPWYLLLRES